MNEPPSQPPSVQPRCRRAWRRYPIVLAPCVWLIAVLIDHRGRIEWDRPSLEIRKGYAYIHIDGGRTRLSSVAEGNRGVVAYSDVRRSLDDRLFATHLAVWRRVSVTLDDRVLLPAEVDGWRAIAARHFASPAILMGDIDRERRIWLGYPLEPLRVFAMMIRLMLPFAPAMVVVVLLLALRRLDPKARRARALKHARCPACSYSLVGLTVNRCPECGETWLASEIEPASPPRGVVSAATAARR